MSGSDLLLEYLTKFFPHLGLYRPRLGVWIGDAPSLIPGPTQIP